MSANLGFFAEDRERDFPELNKCPDCETFFVDANCPLCGKECPEEFRAGNRKPVKQKKHRRPAGNGRVQFVPWYHSVWFIALMFFTVPIVGFILMWSSHWKTHWKIILTVAILLPYIIMAIFGIVVQFTGKLHVPTNLPVNLEMSESDYRETCQTINAEALYRNSEAYVEQYVQMECTVAEVASNGYYTDENEYVIANVYLCRVQIEEKTLEFFVVDYRQANKVRLAVGDKITVWGEVAGEVESGDSTKLPAIYARFIDLE